MAKRKINIEATARNIVDWGNQSIGHSIDIAKLNKKMKSPDAERFFIEAANFCGTEIIYMS